MKILVCGDWHSDLHEAELSRSLRRLGHDVFEFKWFDYFLSDQNKFPLNSILKRVQNKLLLGPLVDRINQDLLAYVRQKKPNLLFIYRGTHIKAGTLKSIRSEFPLCRLVGYNNDDPFSPAQPAYLWRHFNESIQHYDVLLAYRHKNLSDFKGAGAKNVKLMRSWFVPDRNYPVDLDANEREIYGCDVVFVGHFEPDQRLEYLDAIANENINVKIFGPTEYWQKPLIRSRSLSHLAPTSMVWGADYNKVLCGAKIALCFLSKLNRDTYTRRCFEIPASKTMMLSEYSEDLASLYIAGEEVEFFQSKEQMLDLVKYYLAHDNDRERLAKAGYNKVYCSGHDIDTRVKKMLNEVM